MKGNLPKPCYISQTSPNTSGQKIKGLDKALALQPVCGTNTCGLGRVVDRAVFYVGDVQTSRPLWSGKLSFVIWRRLDLCRLNT